MTDLRISELDAAATLDGSELIELVQGGSSVQSTAQAIADLAGAGGAGYTFLSRFGGFNTVVGNSGSSLIMTFDGSTLVPGDFYHLFARLNLVPSSGTPSITVIVGGTSAGTFTLPTLGALLDIESLSQCTAAPGDTYQQILFRAIAVTGAFGAFASMTGNIRPISATTKALATPLTIELRNITGGITVTAGVYGGFLAKF